MTIDLGPMMRRSLERIVASRAAGRAPFLCHKGHWPGPPCLEPVELFKEDSAYTLHHGPHEWEAIGVSKSTADFLTRCLLVSVKRFRRVSSDLVLESIRAILGDHAKGVTPFWCHKGHWPGPACGGPVTLQSVESHGPSLYHIPPPPGKAHDWEAVYVSPEMAKFLRDFLHL